MLLRSTQLIGGADPSFPYGARIALSAHAGRDAIGASGYGYRTLWVNRTHSPTERLAANPEASGVDLNELVEFLDQRQ
jgi:2-haloacid dehalogenase